MNTFIEFQYKFGTFIISQTFFLCSPSAWRIRAKHSFRLRFFQGYNQLSAEIFGTNVPTHLGFHVVEAGRRATCRSGKFLEKCERSRADRWEKLPAMSIFIVRPVGSRTKIPKKPPRTTQETTTGHSVILY